MGCSDSWTPLCKLSSLGKTKVCEDAAADNTVYCCPLGKTLHHQDPLRVLEDCSHVLPSRGSCPKSLGPRTSIMLPLHGLPFLFRGVITKPLLVSWAIPMMIPWWWLAEWCLQVGAHYLKFWCAASMRKLPEGWQWCTDLSGEHVQCATVSLRSCHHLSACIPGESQSFLNEPHTIKKSFHK
jgi:hypothetical protein